ncbi:hypothetical protein B0G62_102139 [Paraburkholderia eburnea]|uniref:Uncharacterized protein n=1 Tax=Paraburkholderia eburnea TaxID=1189126 RepID=A0A2S4MIN6_9BURK|nr:hypothetical protein [Paraburkholderia eburnea]POR54531.1 hypothetical protein B0G62_102139 [Paraburkholderia eburnea]PRZ19746.1 hypothetical protein BX588_114139 [Paraburkholderia eburnea]
MSQDLTARAFEIADQSMVELLNCHAVRHDALTPIFGLSDENGIEVEAIDEADQGIRDAFEWLHLRGLADLIEDAAGTCIVLKGHALDYIGC